MDALHFPEWDSYLRYLDLPGTEPAIVFVPGMYLAGTGAFVPTAVQPGLCDHRRVIVDLLGGGFSDRPLDFLYTLEEHAAVLATLLDDIGVECAVFVGHSLGGAISIALAADRPDLVGRLILAEANLDPGGGALTRFITGYSEAEYVESGHEALLSDLSSRAHHGDGVAPVALGLFALADPIALHRTAVGLSRGTEPTIRELLVGMSVPRRYLFGELSLPDDDYEALPGLGIEVGVVPSAGHAMTAENPSGLARVIGESLL